MDLFNLLKNKEMDKEQIQAAIDKWETKKETKQVLKDLQSVSYFTFSRKDYISWSKTGASAYYVYLGINKEDQLQFFVSSRLIGQIESKTQVIICDPIMNLNKPFSMTKDEAKKRIDRWASGTPIWKENGIVSFFIVPKTDIDIFDISVSTISCYLAINPNPVPLKDGATVNDFIELICRGTAGSSEFTPYKDITRPKPPFRP